MYVPGGIWKPVNVIEIFRALKSWTFSRMTSIVEKLNGGRLHLSDSSYSREGGNRSVGGGGG
jgi:hypothetical protein